MKWLIAFPVVIVVLIVSLSIYLQPNSFVGCDTEPTTSAQCAKADAIVVVSGGDTVARTDVGISLFKNGWADNLIFSGAAQDKTGPSNAEAMKRQAVAAGVPEAVIAIDEASANTQQNAENTRSIVAEKNYHDIILVTSGYHQRRASLEFNRLADDVVVRNYPIASDKDWGWFWWVTPRGWWLAGGEIAKITAFYVGVSS
jgi:uncharacterized SAM-binding protein YcdF (DUF218 family)